MSPLLRAVLTASGFAIAKALARAGAVIAFNCRSQEHLDQAMKDYKREGIDAHGYICDVTDEIHVQQLVREIEKTLGTSDILVNNAGIIKRIPMCDMTTEEFRQVVDIDLVGPFIVSKAVIPGMIKKWPRQNNQYLLYDERIRP